jgi:hypothetical protein
VTRLLTFSVRGVGRMAPRDHMSNTVPIKHPLTGKRQLMLRFYLWELHIFMSVYFIRPLPGTDKGHILWVEIFPQESQTEKLGMEKPCSAILSQFFLAWSPCPNPIPLPSFIQSSLTRVLGCLPLPLRCYFPAGIFFLIYII